jgi:ligand-binding sensor domain-containing protein
MNRFVLITLLCLPVWGTAQLAMQDWRIHFSTFNAIGIAESQSSVFMAAANGVVEYDTDDNSVSVLTVTNGLSDLGISAIASAENTVIIGYGNGNLDIIEENSITNIPWIKTAEISGDKTVNAFYFDGDLIYIATKIGLVVLDNVRKEIKDTYYPFDNPVINDVTIFKDTIYAATNNGIYFAAKTQSYLNNKDNWTKLNNIPVFLINNNIKRIETFGNKLMFLYDSQTYLSDSLYYIENGIFNAYAQNPQEINDIRSDDGKLLLSKFGAMQALDNNLIETDIIFEVQAKYPNIKGSIFREGEYWMADKRSGMTKGLNSWDAKPVYSNSPFADGSYRIDVQNSTVLVAGGGLTHNLQNNFFVNGVYKFQNEEWLNYNSISQDSMNTAKNWDFISIAVDPFNNDHLAFGSNSQGGLLIVKDGKTVSEVYNETNSALEKDGTKIVVSDMKYDNQGNLWILNPGVEPLKMLTPDGIWHSFSLGSSAKNQYVYRLLIDQYDTKWVAVNQVGLIAFNDGGTFTDVSDDQLKTLSTSEGSGNLPSVFVKGLAEDADGELWIGTETGMVVLYNTQNVFDAGYGEYDANPILIEVEGEVEKLLGESDITAITIDGGNRKWIGTSSSGVFCLSPDGTEEIYRYTKENSPLISNNVFDIRTDFATGEMYFATETGLVSVRTDATLGDPEFSNVSVFPNPVRPEYQGVITVQGLGYQSDVKITDVSGNIVYKTTSNGGTVIWDGKTVNGQRVQSGVYLVWAAIVEGKGKEVAKILVIN